MLNWKDILLKFARLLLEFVLEILPGTTLLKKATGINNKKD